MKATPSSKSLRVIALDDDEMLLRLYQIKFSTWPFPITYSAFTEGKKALVEIRRCMPDLLITDWQMPDMNGCDFLKLLYKNFDLSSTTVLVVTSDDLLDLRKSGLIPSCVGILQKSNPYDQISEVARSIVSGWDKIDGS